MGTAHRPATSETLCCKKWIQTILIPLEDHTPCCLQRNQQLQKPITKKEEITVGTCTLYGCKTQWKCRNAFGRAYLYNAEQPGQKSPIPRTLHLWRDTQRLQNLQTDNIWFCQFFLIYSISLSKRSYSLKKLIVKAVLHSSLRQKTWRVWADFFLDFLLAESKIFLEISVSILLWKKKMVSSNSATEQKLQIPTKIKLLLNCFAAALAVTAEKYTVKRLERRTVL